MEVKSENNYYILQSNSSKGILQVRVFLWRSDVAQAIIDDFKKENKSFPELKKCLNIYRHIYMAKVGENPKRILFKSFEYRKIIRSIECKWSKI